jgi:hypothetical protein
MKEITGAGGPSHLSDIAAQRQRSQRSVANPAQGAAGALKRADNAALSIEGRALSSLKAMPQERTEVVNQMSKLVNDPDYDIDGAFEAALEKLFAEM